MPPTVGPPLRGRIGENALLVVLLAGSFLLPAVLMRGKSATFDEVAHLPAGYSYLTTGVFKINPQHPPLIKEICALPLLFMDLKMPVDRETLRRSRPGLTYQWGFGRKFLYSQDADRILFWGRIPAVVLSLGLAILTALWARKLWGTGGGLLAAALYLIDPTLTAHAQLVTTDVGLACFATLFLFVLRGYVERPTRARLVVSGLTLGLALAAKFSAVLLIPIALFLLLLASRREAAAAQADPATGGGNRRMRSGKGRRPGREPAQPGESGSGTVRPPGSLAGFAIMLAIAAVVIWALYFFSSDPLVYLKAFATVNKDHDPGYFPYLLGEMKPGGWVSYLLIAYLVKTPLPSLVLLAAAVVAFFRGRRAPSLDEAFLAVPGLAFFIGYSLTADNLGVRYLIPCFPFFMIFTARLAPAVGAAKLWAKGAVAALLIWAAMEFAVIWPDHLSYFNQVTGIPPRGSRWLDDSNLDWGQGLIQLRDYLREHPVADYRFCYFGSGDPAYYGIRGSDITVKGLLPPPPPGTYILSAHCVARARAELSGLYGQGSGNWLANAVPRVVVGHVFEIYEIR